MKKNRIAIAILSILIVLAIVMVWNNRYLTTLRGDAADFQVRDTASVTKLFFADKNGKSVLLQRTEAGWIVNDTWKAQQAVVNEMLYTLDKLRIKKPVSVASHDNVVTRMATNNTKVEVYQIVPRINLFNKVKLFYHETRTKAFYIGDVTQDNNGTYILKEGADQAYVVYLLGFRGFISSRFSADPIDWRSHLMIAEKIGNIASLKIEFFDKPEESFEVTELGRYSYSMKRVSDGSSIDFDTLRILNLLTSFSDVRFEAFLDDVAPQRRDSIIKSPCLEKITLRTKDGKGEVIATHPLKINADAFGFVEDDWDFDPDHKYAYIENSNDLVMIQDFVFGKILKPASYYEKGKAEPLQMIHYQELEEIPSQELPR